MNAHIHMNAREREQLRKEVKAIADKERVDISTRAQYLWGMAMYQAGLSPRTIRRVIKAMPTVTEIYKEYRTDKLADCFCQITLADLGVALPETENKQ